MKQADYTGYAISKSVKNHHADFLIFLFTKDSSEIKNGTGTSFLEFFDEKFLFVILQRLAKFPYQTVFTSQVIHT